MPFGTEDTLVDKGKLGLSKVGRIVLRNLVRTVKPDGLQKLIVSIGDVPENTPFPLF